MHAGRVVVVANTTAVLAPPPPCQRTSGSPHPPPHIADRPLARSRRVRRRRALGSVCGAAVVWCASYRLSPSWGIDAWADGLTRVMFPLSTQARWLGAKRGESRPSL